jgi:hypothetical protein
LSSDNEPVDGSVTASAGPLLPCCTWLLGELGMLGMLAKLAAWC